jgi:DNA processing protein
MEKFLPWFALKCIPGVGNHIFKLLIERFNNPASVFESSIEDLLFVSGVTPDLARTILSHQMPDSLKKEVEDVYKKGYHIVTLSDEDYPRLLLKIHDPPPFLYVFGSIDSSIKNIAVVGSRQSTTYGIKTTHQLCKDLASCGITIVSGMAKGIDTAAHIGAMEGNGRTIAVLGSGFDQIYPKENKNLFYKIAEQGAVVSEFSLSTKPEAYHFPKRNRIISGMSLGTVVVEAAKRSGSLITARLAMEQNREVFAVPGNIHSFKSTGTHNLIKQGAKLVETVDDILEELANVIPYRDPVNGPLQGIATDIKLNLSKEEKLVLDTLGTDPLHIDEIMRKVSMESGKLSSLLLQLELKGVIDQSVGKYFSVNIK